MFFARAKELIYFNNKRIKEGQVFVIRPKQYFCRADSEMKVMTVKEQFSSATMSEVSKPKAKSNDNTNWEQSEEDRIAMADAAAQAEIDSLNETRLKREAEEKAAIDAINSGSSTAENFSEDGDIVLDEANMEEEVI